MGWKFWQRKETETPDVLKVGKKLPRPKDLPYEVGRHLVVVDGFSPDWVWQLRSALKPRENQKNIVDFRLFSPETAVKSNIHIRDYTSLDQHPELVIFAGWYEKETRKVQVEKLLEDVG